MFCFLAWGSCVVPWRQFLTKRFSLAIGESLGSPFESNDRECCRVVRCSGRGVLGHVFFTSAVFCRRGGVEGLPRFLRFKNLFYHAFDGRLEFGGFGGDFAVGGLWSDKFLGGEDVGESHEQTEKYLLHAFYLPVEASCCKSTSGNLSLLTVCPEVS